MKNRFSRIFVLALALVLMVSAFAGCGAAKEQSETSTAAASTSSAAETSAGTAAESSTPAAEPLKEVTLKFFIPGDEKAAKKDVLNYLYEQTKDRLNAKFEINFVAFGDYVNKMTMMAAAGDQYDACFTADWFGFNDLVNKGAFLGLNDLMPQYAPNLLKVYDDSGISNTIKVNGQIMALPWTRIKTSKPTFVWRQDLADKIGVQPGEIKTIEDVDKYLTEVAKANPGTTVFDMNIGGGGMHGDIVTLLIPKYELYETLFHQFVTDLNDSTNKIIPLEQSDLFREAVKYAKKWYDAGIISKNALSFKEANPFENGKVFSQKNISERLYETVNFVDKTAKCNGVEVYADKKFARDSQLNNAMAINKNAANPERTLMFMDLITTDKDVYTTLWYGIKDKTYTTDASGIIGFAPGEDPGKPLWQNWMAWGFLRANFETPTATRSAEAIQKEIEFATRSNIVMPPLKGYIPDPTPIKTELAKRDQLFEEQGKLLLAGIVKGDVDKAVDEYIEKQKAVGLDKIMAEVQKQIDENVK
jgi:putative aldouronate transport system substrate-binding protein